MALRRSNPDTVGRTRRRRTPRHLRRTWGERALVTSAGIVGFASLASAAGLWLAYDTASEVQRVSLPIGLLDPVTTTVTEDGTTIEARNVLLYASDSRGCIPDNPQYAGGFDDGTQGGRTGLSDSIMIMRVDPSADQVVALSLPRDLWVQIAGTRRQAKLNSALNGGTERLVETIQQNFDIPINHFVEVDFCGVKSLVEEIGGVPVPFDRAVRDPNTGIVVPEPACVNVDGDMAVAYLRSRFLEIEREPGSGRYRQDPTADIGRIQRQQDFLKRAIDRAVKVSGRNPVRIRGLVEVGLDNVTVDDRLTIGEAPRIALSLRDLDPGAVRTFTIDAYGAVRSGQSVLLRREDSTYNRDVGRLFRGEVRLGEAPPDDTGIGVAPTVTLPGTTTTVTTVTTATTVPGDSTPPTDTTVPEVVIDDTDTAAWVPSGDLCA